MNASQAARPAASSGSAPTGSPEEMLIPVLVD